MNESAIDCLPDDLKSFYSKNKQKIIEESITPDLWKEDDALERSRHYIDLDFYDVPPFSFFPVTYEETQKKFGKAKMGKWGILPWRIEEFFNNLVDAFQKKDLKKIVEISAWVGHYVADGHVPLHTTKNYDGQLTGNKGIHLRFEMDMLKIFQKQFIIQCSSPVVVGQNELLGFTFNFLKEGFEEVEALLRADNKAKKQGAPDSKKYFNALYQESHSLAKRRLEKASRALASLWVEAWVRAGKPELSK